MRNYFRMLIAVFLIPLSWGIRGVRAQEDAPNVLFFLVDDMGWTDSSVYGSTFYPTPAMERLAESSVRFVNAYSASPLCSPSRASIMSGQYPARHGMTTAWGHTPQREDDPDYQREHVPVGSEYLLPYSRRVLELDQYTLAEAFRDAGYRTGFVGKWHMGLAPEYWPEEQGFESTFHGAPDPGPPSYFSPYRFRAGNVTDGPEGEYLTDRATDEALGFLRSRDDRPFFLCLWHWGVHGPFQAKEDLIEYYRNHPDPRGVQKSPTYAAMIHSVDESLGDILDYLEEAGLDENTIIVFTSDNGGVEWKGVKADGGVPATSNAPLKKGKGTIFEGGSRVPAMIRWPGVADRERVSEAVITGVDYYPTLLEMCGIAKHPDQTIDGVSLVPTLKAGTPPDREAIYCFFPHNFGERSPAGCWVRMGDWKLIENFYVSDLHPDRYQLYNLEADLGETENLAEQYPERTRQMARMLKDHYRTLCDRPPIPNPDYDPSLLPVAGWNGADRHSGWPETDAGTLIVTGRGISTRGLPRETGSLALRWTARSSREGQGRFFWSDRSDWQFRRERSTEFRLQGDGRRHDYIMDFEVGDELIGVRIDVPRGEDPVVMEEIELLDGKGRVLRRWDFE
ncbi:sulfatase [Kiritimatiella glycovorans]|uniref:Arylsulfatase n=1 Tax=Kiritimatiella glycovorans TaxID=1307763 RepID=A0A0G3EGN7_9BACT|nr:sulfatase [Kiritimatiella glycovorans]AKJ64587.1 Arylsulfatase [Kiritimatiella glycovorans]